MAGSLQSMDIESSNSFERATSWDSLYSEDAAADASDMRMSLQRAAESSAILLQVRQTWDIRIVEVVPPTSKGGLDLAWSNMWTRISVGKSSMCMAGRYKI
jgi:hypothetical protein